MVLSFSPILLGLTCLSVLLVEGADNRAQCNNQIYCVGPILETVQNLKVFRDCKHFVDMKLKFPPDEVQKHFRVLQNVTKAMAETFLKENFDEVSSEFETWDPNDWKKEPSFIKDIRDSNYQKWALALNNIWKILGRKLKDEVRNKNELYSMIWIPNPFIIPGGRFREYYYWDSYWVVNGLLICEMYDTVRGMLENFVFIINKLGYIPNGGRIYYMGRSQPPLFIPAVKLYLDATKDEQFIKTNIGAMELEFVNYWEHHKRTFNMGGTDYTLASYQDGTKRPRPESYTEDIETANVYQTKEEKEICYTNLRAGAESGWDFSSRWFVKNGSDQGANLSDTKTQDIAAVDLNAFLYLNAKLLSQFFETIVNDSQKAETYKTAAECLLQNITAVFWRDDPGVWLDYDIANGISRNYFFPSNLVPLFARCYNEEDKSRIVRSVMDYMQKNDVVYPGGIPTSLKNTEEQWDFPNAWPPLQHMVIIGLNNTGILEAQKKAYEIAKIWIDSNYKAYSESENDVMYEKYDARTPGLYGGGGEYIIQTGFGWTNGVILDLLNMYGRNAPRAPNVVTALQIIMFVLLGTFIVVYGIAILLLNGKCKGRPLAEDAQ